MKNAPGMLAAVLILCSAMSSLAEEIIIEDVQADRHGEQWNFAVTLLHADGGWDHYADGWEVLDQSGERLGYRELLHPHVNEQPFTRSLSGVPIPKGSTKVVIRAHCSVDGWVGEPFELTLTE